MPAVTIPDTDQVICLRAAWQAYESLLATTGDDRGALLSFDGETIELMSPGSKHERIANRIAYLLSAVVTAWRVNLEETGSTTFKVSGERGFEADKSYYAASAARVRDFDAIDLSGDPPPDLVIEVDITSTRIDKAALYASMGIPEFWRYRDERLLAFTLTAGTYTEIDRSRVIAGLPIAELGRRITTDGSRLSIVTEWQQWLADNRHLHEPST